MKERKFIFTLLCFTVVLCLPVNSLNITASTNDNNTVEEVLEHVNSHSSWGKVKKNEALNIRGTKFELLVTFNNPEQALKKFKSAFAKELEIIRIEYNLQDLNKDTYSDYYAIIRNEGTQFFKEKDVNEVLGFFDIYENNDNNLMIKNKASLLNRRTVGTNEEALLEEIDALSPSYNQPLGNYNQSRVAIHLTDINVKNATAYAKKYANSPNSSYKYYNNHDCTNFASQIAYAGGLRNGTAWKPYTGSWTVANSFAITWGKRGKSTKWSSFVKTLKPGNFIGADFFGDGHMDHIAYITANGSTSSIKYIAQHSGNFQGPSNSSKCGWPNDSGGRIIWIIGNK